MDSLLPQNLTEPHQEELMQFITEYAPTQRKLTRRAQMQDSSQLFSELTENCFNACVNDFRSVSLDSKENGCIERCSDKLLMSMMRVSQRFQEISQREQQMMGQQMADNK